MKLEILKESYSVCRLANESSIPEWAINGIFYSITKTNEELSIVCESKFVPIEIKREDNWFMIKILGPLDFSEIGIINKISSVFKRVNKSLFVISTYDTDYIMCKKNNISELIEELENEDYSIINRGDIY